MARIAGMGVAMKIKNDVAIDMGTAEETSISGMNSMHTGLNGR